MFSLAPPAAVNLKIQYLPQAFWASFYYYCFLLLFTIITTKKCAVYSKLFLTIF